MITAVDESTKPDAPIKAAAHGKPAAMPTNDKQHDARNNLRSAQSKNLFAQRPEFRGPHFEADDEQEHHHAEFGDVQDRSRDRGRCPIPNGPITRPAAR
jgi:hypothetical protein